MNVILDIVIIVLIIIYPFLNRFVDSYFAKKGENIAQKEDCRDISYEKKKGENLATKEDVQEITKQMETIKSEISFENQRKNEFINQRTQRLLEILFMTEKFNEYQRILMFALYDKNSSDRLHTLIEQINETLLKLTHEYRITTISTNDKDLSERIEELIEKSQNYSVFMCYIASNALNHIDNWNAMLDLGNKSGSNSTILEIINESKSNFDKIRKEFEDGRNEHQINLYNSQIKYMSKLNLLYGKEFHLKDDVKL